MREEEVWKKDLAQEYKIYAMPSWLPGVWPLLPDNIFTAFRFYIAVILLVIIIQIIIILRLFVYKNYIRIHVQIFYRK